MDLLRLWQPLHGFRSDPISTVIPERFLDDVCGAAELERAEHVFPEPREEARLACERQARNPAQDSTHGAATYAEVRHLKRAEPLLRVVNRVSLHPANVLRLTCRGRPLKRRMARILPRPRSSAVAC